MAYTKTNWANGGTPPISAANLNNIENGIYNCDNAINHLATYSTTETPVGTWVDGKIIYRKVLQSNQVTGASVTVAHGISNLGAVIKADIFASNFNGTTYLLDNPTYTLQCKSIDGTNINMNISTAFGAGWYVRYVLEYVKTS